MSAMSDMLRSFLVMSQLPSTDTLSSTAIHTYLYTSQRACSHAFLCIRPSYQPTSHTQCSYLKVYSQHFMLFSNYQDNQARKLEISSTAGAYHCFTSKKFVPIASMFHMPPWLPKTRCCGLKVPKIASRVPEPVFKRTRRFAGGYGRNTGGSQMPHSTHAAITCNVYKHAAY